MTRACRVIFLCCFAFFLSWAPALQAGELAKPMAMAAFSDSQSRTYDLSNSDMLVFVFLAPDSSSAFTCMPTAVVLAMKTKQMGGDFFGVVSGNSYSATAVEAFGKASRGNFPIILDHGRTLDTVFGAEKVGTAAIVQGRKLLYKGFIDHRFDPLTENSESIALEEELDMRARKKSIVLRGPIKTATGKSP